MKEEVIKEEEKKETSKIKDILDFLVPIVIAVIVAILLKTFVFANCIIPSASMLNTLQVKDRVIASRLAYINNDPERYDIVIFEYPDEYVDPEFTNMKKPVYFAKRVIGLPGETVQIVNGVVYVTQPSGKTIQLDNSFVTVDKPVGNFGPYEVPEGCYFMMGDNRQNSKDSRYWENKFVEKDKIIGKVKFRYYPKISAVE